MIEIKLIDSAHKKDIRIKNDPFLLWGRLIPIYQNETWGYDIEECCDMKDLCTLEELKVKSFNIDDISKEIIKIINLI